VSAYSVAVLTDSPDVYYRLDETGAGPFVDVANAHNATPDGTIVTAASLLVTDADAAAKFDPATTLTQATTGYIVAQQPMTVEFWINPASLTGSIGGTSIVLGHTNSTGTNGWICDYVDSTGVWQWTLSAVAFYPFASAVKAQIGVKQHIAFVLTASTVELFVNGASQGTIAVGTMVAATGHLVIGSSEFSTANRQRPKATIDEIAIYKSAISGARIAAHFLAGTTSGMGGGMLLSGVG
jgi:hypothetical protein